MTITSNRELRFSPPAHALKCHSLSTRSSQTNEIYMIGTDIFTSTTLSFLDIQKKKQILSSEDFEDSKLHKTTAECGIYFNGWNLELSWFSRDNFIFFFLLLKNNYLNECMHDQTLTLVRGGLCSLPMNFLCVDVCGGMILKQS